MNNNTAADVDGGGSSGELQCKSLYLWISRQFGKQSYAREFYALALLGIAVTKWVKKRENCVSPVAEITYGGFSRTVRESAAMLSYQFHELCALIHRAGGESKCRRGGGQI